MKYAEIVHERDGKWWFWAEDWATEYGPFDSEKEASDAALSYMREVLG